MMEKKQLAALFACGLVGWTIAQGTLALLPVYAVRLGADPAWAGYYLALAFVAVTLGTLAAGWLSDRFQRRKALLPRCPSRFCWAGYRIVWAATD